MVTSPGHKLGQMIGNFFENFFGEIINEFADNHKFYFDKKGLRPGVRGKLIKVTWEDEDGNTHDLDYVLERNGTDDHKGEPVAFIEIAWRRYTKHSRNKTGEIEGALVHLGRTYHTTCGFLGAILGGQYTDGGITQLKSHGINVLYVPFATVTDVFQIKDIDLNYPENAPDSQKQEIIDGWNSLNEDDIDEIVENFRNAISDELNTFVNEMERQLLRKVRRIRIYPLYGCEKIFTNIAKTINVIQDFESFDTDDMKFIKFEILVEFNNNDVVEGSFHEKSRAMDFLRLIAGSKE